MLLGSEPFFDIETYCKIYKVKILLKVNATRSGTYFYYTITTRYAH